MRLQQSPIWLFALYCTSIWSAASGAPLGLEAHIDRQRDEICAMKRLPYSEEDKEILVENASSVLAKRFARTHDEARAQILAVLRSADCAKKKYKELDSVDSLFLARLNFYGLTPNRNGVVNFVFDGVRIPFIAEHVGVQDSITIRGINVSGADHRPCLQLNFPPGEIKIEWLVSDNKVCPIPRAERVGAYLLELSMAMSRQLKKPLKLLDESVLRCPKNKISVPFAYLKVFQEGVTWYGKYGFKTQYEISHRDAPPVGTTLQQHSLQPIADALTDAQENLCKRAQSSFAARIYCHNLNGHFKLFVDKMDEFKTTLRPDEDTRLGPFFSWLWLQDCAAYTDLFSLVYPNDLAINTVLSPYQALFNALKLPLHDFYFYIPEEQ